MVTFVQSGITKKKTQNILRLNFNLPILLQKPQELYVCVVHKPECEFTPILVPDLTLGETASGDIRLKSHTQYINNVTI